MVCVKRTSAAMTFGSSESDAFKQRVKLRVTLACTQMNTKKCLRAKIRCQLHINNSN